MGNICCTRCNETRPEEAFSRHAKRSTGRQAHCKACFAEYKAANAEKLRQDAKADYLKNAEAYKARALAWRAANADRKAALDKAWRAANLDRKKANDAAWYAQNTERKKAYDAEWRPAYLAANRHIPNAQRARRRARLAQAMPAWADLERINAVYEMAAQMPGHEVDHIIPLAGELACGLHVADNLQVIPTGLNRAKRHRFQPYSIQMVTG